MKYLLDTNICIFLINQKSQHLLKRLLHCTPEDIAISAITLAELMYGAEKSVHRDKNVEALNQFLVPLNILPFHPKAAIAYGAIRMTLERAGTPIGPLDTLIAAHAISEHLILVSNNSREFSRVQDLTVEDWTVAPGGA